MAFLMIEKQVFLFINDTIHRDMQAIQHSMDNIR